MKRMIILLFCLSLFACKEPEEVIIHEKEPVIETPTEKPADQVVTKPVYVLNTKWEVVRNENMSRAIESTDLLKEEVEAHNKDTINDKWYLYVGSYPEIKDSPNCDIFIVDKVTYIPVAVDNGVGGTYELTWNDYPRQSMVAHLENWRHDAQMYNALLYIDVIPPPPVIVEPTKEDLYAKYTINVIGFSGALIHAEHCSEMDLTDWHCTRDEYFAKRIAAWNFDIMYNATYDDPWHMVTGKLYEVGD
jgi:hypothetical protein